MEDELVEALPVIDNDIPGEKVAAAAVTTNPVPGILIPAPVKAAGPGNPTSGSTNNHASHENITVIPPPEIGYFDGHFVGSVTLEDLDALEELEMREKSTADEGPEIRARVISNDHPVSTNQAMAHTVADDLNNNIVAIPNIAVASRARGNGGRRDGWTPGDDGSDNRFIAVLKSLPPISTSVSVAMIILYFLSGYFLDSEDDINVCWSKVMDQRQFWRILVAHFFHFGRLHIAVNVITLMSMGRYLEKKINKTAMVVLIVSMGVLSNILYLIISKIVGEVSKEMSTYGFAHVHYGLRVVLAMLQEDVEHHTLILGFFPVLMSATWAPWQPLLEVFLLKLITQDMPVSGQIAGIISGFIVTYCLRRFKPSSFGPEVVPNQSTSDWTRSPGRRLGD